MRIRLLSVAVLISVLMISLTSRGVRSQPGTVADELQARAATQGTVRVIVRLDAPFVPEGRLASLAQVLGQRQLLAGAQSTVRGQLRGVRHRVVREFGGTLPLLALEASPEALQMLASLRGIVARIYEDRLSAPGLAQSIPVIKANEVWNTGFDGSGQIVAVLDTGVQKAHSFFSSGKVIAEACFSTNFAPAGITSLCPGGVEFSAASGSGRPCTVAECDHGTHVAGIAAGAGDASSGVAKGARIIAIQVFSRFPGSFCGTPSPCILSFSSDQIAALNHVHARRLSFPGHRVASVNLSLGSGAFQSPCDVMEPYKPAIDQLRAPHPGDPGSDPGVATTIAAGNEGFTDAISAPACISSAIPVASATKSDGVSSFSNLAAPTIFPSILFAPGSSITSAVPPGPDTFAVLSGTSMAAPHVAGALAVLREIEPTASVDELIAHLKNTGRLISDERPPCSTCDGGFSVPRIDVQAAAAALAPPNLVVQTLTAPTTGIPGGTMSVTASVRNTGAGPAGPSSLRVYLSADDVITPQDTLLGSARIPDLAGGVTSPVITLNLQIPLSTAPGTYRVGAIADADDRVVEGNESDNTRVAGPVRLALPDLTVSAIVATPGASGPGLNVSVTHTVKNVATAPGHAPASTSRLYLSSDALFGSGVSLGTVAIPALPAGASRSVTASVMLPAGTSPGRYWIFAAANDDRSLTEAATSNNVRGTARAMLVGPDLVVTTATATPRVTVPGATVNVTHTIRNQGGAPAAPFDVGIYLSMVNVQGSDTLLTTHRVTGLAVGARSAATRTVTIPATVLAGTYRILVRADSTGGPPQEVAEADEANNVLATPAIQVARPDLAVLSVTGPATTAPGRNVHVSYTVKNTALPPAVAPASRTRLYLSPDARLDVPGDVAVGEAPVRALAGGTQAAVTRAVTIPAGTSPGRYWILVRANATNTVPEADAPGLANNVRATATPILIGADLVVTSATATPRATAPGAIVNVTHTIRNRGGAGTGPFDVGIYLSTDTGFGDDVLLKTRRVTAVGVRATWTGTTLVRMPANVSAGTHVILVRADADDEVPEAEERNNLLATAALRAVRPDLTVQAVTAPAVAAPGASVRVRHVVRNVAAPAGKAGASTTRFYLSPDARLDVPGDVMVGEAPVSALAGGTQAVVTRTVTIPAETAPGQYWILAQANATNTVPEVDAPGLANNVRATATPILVGADLVVTGLTTTTKLASPNFTFPVTTKVKNQGSLSAGPSAVKFYLNTTPTLAGSPIPVGASATAPLAPSASVTTTTRLTVPGNTSAGAYFVLAEADGSSLVVAEANETNNVRATATAINVQLPNLTIVSIAPPAVAIRGKSTAAPTGSVVVRNIGPGPSAPFAVQVFASRDDGSPGAAEPGRGDVIFTRIVPRLAPGAQKLVGGPIIVPESVGPDVRPAGNYYLSTVADAAGVTMDPSPDNNAMTWLARKIAVVPDMTRLRSATVNLTLAPACDVASLALGGPFSVTSQTLANPSSFAATGLLTDTVGGTAQRYSVRGTVQAVDGSGTAGRVQATFTYTATSPNTVASKGSGTLDGAAPALDFPGGTITGQQSGLPGCTFTGSIDIVR